MRIFYICQRVPFPPDRGDKITTYNEIKHLARQHQVHVFCMADGALDLANVVKVKDFAASIQAVAVSSFGAKWRAALALLTGEALSVAAFSNRALHHAIRQAHARTPADVMIVYSCNVAQYAAHFPDCRRIMQFADLDSLKWGQYAERHRPPMKWLYALEQRRLLAYERMIAHSFDHSLVCTAVEQRDFEALIPGAPISLVANGVDLDYFKSAHLAKIAGRIVFTGVMDYLPNIDAVEWFCAEIFPQVRQALPQASFVICGSRPTEAVKQLARIDGVSVTGWVEDTRPHLDVAQVFVAPLRMARGVQNKVLEGLAMGLPCVTSMTAWSGTVIAQGQGIVASNDPAELAQQIVRLLSDANYRGAMALRARQAVEANYTWGAQMDLLDGIIARLVKAPPKLGNARPKVPA